MPNPTIAPLATGSPTQIPLQKRMLWRAALLSLGALALLTGLWGAMVRLGWDLPQSAALASLHGPLMISGLFGTLISLERAVALDRLWSYAAPLLSGFGTLSLLAGMPDGVGAAAYVFAAAILVCASLLITIQQPALFTGALLFGALAWFSGNLLWLLGHSVPDLVGWWIVFLVQTIAGERLELSRLMQQRRGSEVLFLFAGGLSAVGAQNGVTTENGAVLFGLGLLLTTIWLLRYDIARLNISRIGQTCFMAACMMAGYAWLGVAGLGLIAFPVGLNFGYDIVLHSILIGFVLSMVSGHALIILPAVARLRLRYDPILYVPLITLHASVALRVVAGLGTWDAGRKISGILTLVALVGFVGSLVIAKFRGRSNQRLTS